MSFIDFLILRRHVYSLWIMPGLYKVKQINGNFGQISKEQILYRSYRPLPDVGKIGLNLT